jgi:hypothetical protein
MASDTSGPAAAAKSVGEAPTANGALSGAALARAGLRSAVLHLVPGEDHTVVSGAEGAELLGRPALARPGPRLLTLAALE